MEVRRIVMLAKAKAVDPVLGSVIGLLRLTKPESITDKRMQAGVMFGQNYGRYEAAMGLPRRSAASPAYQRGYGRAAPQSYLEDDRVRSIRERWEQVRQCLRTRDPSGRIYVVLERVIIDDTFPAPGELDVVMLGLDILCVHFGISPHSALTRRLVHAQI